MTEKTKKSPGEILSDLLWAISPVDRDGWLNFFWPFTGWFAVNVLVGFGASVYTSSGGNGPPSAWRTAVFVGVAVFFAAEIALLLLAARKLRREGKPKW